MIPVHEDAEMSTTTREVLAGSTLVKGAGFYG